MRFYLHGQTALWMWHRMDEETLDAKATTLPLDCVASVRSFEVARGILQDIPAPWHVCVDAAHSVRRADGFCVHVLDSRITASKFYTLGKGVCIASPELAFLQAAAGRTVSFAQLVRHGNALAASYFIDDGAQTGLGSRKPLLTRASLLKFLRRQSAVPGLSRALAAAANIYDAAASPKESEFTIKACMPAAQGGRNCPTPELNYKIVPKNKSRRLADKTFYRVDFCFPDKKLAVEYDSNLAHLTPEQKRHDEAKRQTLEREGFKVVSVVAAHLSNREQFNKIMDEILRIAGARVKNRSQKFERAQRELFKEFATHNL